MRKLRDRVLKGLLLFCGALCAGLLLFLLIAIAVRAAGALTWQLLTTKTSYLNDKIGILPNLLNTVYLVFTTLLFVLPLGVGAAVYLTEYVKRPRIAAAITFATETLSGIPSILFGLVGMLVFTRLFSLQAGILAGALTMTMMVLPVLVRTTQESLKAVPNEYREGALALGAGKFHMIQTVVLPTAVPGIVTGCILSIGRIVGESAALLYTAGFGLALNGYFTALQSSSATLTVALYVYAGEHGKTDVAFAIGAVLTVLTLILNWAAHYFGRKRKEIAP